MNLKNCLLITCLSLLALLLTSCQMLTNRKPQSAGFRGYCPTCLMKNAANDVKNLQKIVQNNKYLFRTSKLAPEKYDIYPSQKCSWGYVEGIKKRYEGSNQKYMECLSKKHSLSYYVYQVHIDGNCAEGYVEGRKYNAEYLLYKNLYVYKSMVCLSKRFLLNEGDDYYYTHLNGKCAAGYVEGRKIKTSSISTHDHLMKCFNKNTLPTEYQVHIDGDCAKEYVEGRRYDNKPDLTVDDYDSINCLAKKNLPNTYEVHKKGECAEGYKEMTMNEFFTDGYDFKKCILHTVEK